MTLLDKSEARKTAILPISRGVCSFFIGTDLSTVFSKYSRPLNDLNSGDDSGNFKRFLDMASHIGVHNNPGHIALTFISNGANWSALD